MTSPRRADGESGIDTVRSEVLRLSELILRAICSHDPITLEALLASDFIFIGDSKRLDRGAFLEAVGAGGFLAIEHGFDSIEVEMLGAVAAAAGIQRVEVELPDGTRAVSRACFTDVFIKDVAEWRLRLAHSVELS